MQWLSWAQLDPEGGSGLPALQVPAWPGELPIFLTPLEQGLLLSLRQGRMGEGSLILLKGKVGAKDSLHGSTTYLPWTHLLGSRELALMGVSTLNPKSGCPQSHSLLAPWGPQEIPIRRELFQHGGGAHFRGHTDWVEISASPPVNPVTSLP